MHTASVEQDAGGAKKEQDKSVKPDPIFPLQLLGYSDYRDSITRKPDRVDAFLAEVVGLYLNRGTSFSAVSR